MYSYGFMDIPLDSKIIPTNQSVTFTYGSGKIVDFNTDSGVMADLGSYLTTTGYGTVVSVNRPFLSGRYSVVIIPSSAMPVSTWRTIMRKAWESMGYPNTELVSIDSGTVSFEPGGVTGIIQKVAEAPGQLISKTLAPTMPYLIIGGIILVAGVIILYVPRPKRREK